LAFVKYSNPKFFLIDVSISDDIVVLDIISKSSETGDLNPVSYCLSKKSESENSCFVFDRRAKSGEQLNTIFAPSKGITI
jgi:hypothetical protein